MLPSEQFFFSSYCKLPGSGRLDRDADYSCSLSPFLSCEVTVSLVMEEQSTLLRGNASRAPIRVITGVT